MKIINYATCPVHTVRNTDPIDKAIALMEEHEIHHIVVTCEGKTVGMLSDRDILISTGWMLAVERTATVPSGEQPHLVGPSRVEQIMSTPVECVAPDTEASQVARIMLEHRFGALPILRNGTLVAIVTQSDMLRWMGQLSPHDLAIRRILGREARSAMRVHVFTVTPEASLGEVVQLFQKHHMHHVVVARGVELLGMISDRDVRRALGWSSIRDMQTDTMVAGMQNPGTAEEVMKDRVISAAPRDLLSSVLEKMLTARIHAIPIADNGRLEGILTGTDFLREITRQEAL